VQPLAPDDGWGEFAFPGHAISYAGTATNFHASVSNSTAAELTASSGASALIVHE
jgi:hypothetical protein